MCFPIGRSPPRVDGPRPECPNGYQYSSRAQWEAQFPTEESRKAMLAKHLLHLNRGPNGEHAWIHPEAVKDPLPFRELQTKTALGVNLDGTPDGRATAKTCRHEKFTGVDGEPAVDNQLYRAVGCMRSSGGEYLGFLNAGVRTRAASRVLMEISGIDNEVNDDAVEVTLYKGTSPAIAKDAANKALAWQTHEIDRRAPQFTQRLRGRIVDGVLITEPQAVRWPTSVRLEPFAFDISDMQLRLKMTEEGAEGMLVGYQSLESLWRFLARVGTLVDPTANMSGPTLYAALHRYADGGKDPQTGQCTAISAAHKVGFVRAFIVHPPTEGRMADASSPSPAGQTPASGDKR